MTRTIEEHIGRKVVALRQKMDWNQRELAEALEKATGKKWERQSVWAAEHGKRAWAVADLLGLAEVFDLTVAELVSTDESLVVGGVEKSPREITMRTEGDAHIQGHWKSFHALAGVASIQRTVNDEYFSILRELRKQVSISPELRQMIETYRDKIYEVQEAAARRDAQNDDTDVSTPEKLKAYMDEWGYNAIPVIKAARDVLDPEEEVNGRS